MPLWNEILEIPVTSLPSVATLELKVSVSNVHSKDNVESATFHFLATDELDFGLGEERLIPSCIERSVDSCLPANRPFHIRISCGFDLAQVQARQQGLWPLLQRGDIYICSSRRSISFPSARDADPNETSSQHHPAPADPTCSACSLHAHRLLPHDSASPIPAAELIACGGNGDAGQHCAAVEHPASPSPAPPDSDPISVSISDRAPVPADADAAGGVAAVICSGRRSPPPPPPPWTAAAGTGRVPAAVGVCR